MTATLHDLLKSYREGGVFPSYDQLAAIAGQDQIGAAVRGKAVAEVLKEARAFIEANSGEVGCGFHRPANPHEFHPDAEMCSAEEIAAHKAACEAYDKGEFKQDSELGWIGPNVHVLTAPWGIGSYAYRSEEAEGMLAKIDAALSDRAADAPSEPGELHRRVCDVLEGLEGMALPGALPARVAKLRVAVAEFESRAADALDSQPTEPDGLPPLPEPIEVGGEGWDFDDFKSEKTFSCEHMWAYARAAIASSQPTEQRPTDDELWDATLRDRDAYHEWADKLADAIALHCGVDIGEHSNQNLPWAEALEAIESADCIEDRSQPTDGGVRNG